MGNWTTLSFYVQQEHCKSLQIDDVFEKFYNQLSVPVMLDFAADAADAADDSDEADEAADSVQKALLEKYGGKLFGASGSEAIKTLADRDSLKTMWADEDVSGVYLTRYRDQAGTQLFKWQDQVGEALKDTITIWGQAVSLKKSKISGFSDNFEKPIEIDACLEISMHSQDDPVDWFDVRESILNNNTVARMQEWLKTFIPDIEVAVLTSF